MKRRTKLRKSLLRSHSSHSQPTLNKLMAIEEDIITKKSGKPKFKLIHDLCSRSTLFLGLCETFLFDGINDCESRFQISL